MTILRRLLLFSAVAILAGRAAVSNTLGESSSDQRFDVNRDGVVSPSDALMVIEHLNQSSAGKRTRREST